MCWRTIRRMPAAWGETAGGAPSAAPAWTGAAPPRQPARRAPRARRACVANQRRSTPARSGSGNATRPGACRPRSASYPGPGCEAPCPAPMACVADAEPLPAGPADCAGRPSTSTSSPRGERWRGAGRCGQPGPRQRPAPRRHGATGPRGHRVSHELAFPDRGDRQPPPLLSAGGGCPSRKAITSSHQRIHSCSNRMPRRMVRWRYCSCSGRPGCLRNRASFSS